MKISIITPTLNHARFIEDTILSVLQQDYKNYEHIIIDGGSTDGTVEILKKYPHLKWISEKDNGQSAAINKGVKMAKGDILTWINSDDWYENGALSIVAGYFRDHGDCFFMYGDQIDVDENKYPIGARRGNTMFLGSLIKTPDVVRQPVCFWRKEVAHTVGYLDETLHLVMDYDYFLRIAKHYSFHHVNKTLCCFRMHKGAKTSALAKKQVHEIYQVMKKESGGFPYRFCLVMAKRFYASLKRSIYSALRVLS
jgi:glycosyltransferase involved in cell wall biosynthesis